jgi:hypothetical protein
LLHYSPNRSGATAEFLLKGFSGYLQSDGYGGYNSVANQVEVTQLGCWAHARRKFVDITKSGVSDESSKITAKKAVELIGKLYGIEREIKDEPPDEKRVIRQEKAKPIITNIRVWLDANFLQAQNNRGALAKALVYLVPPEKV